MIETTCTAFVGTKLIASGPVLEVAAKAKAAWDRDKWTSVLIFDDTTSEVIDVDYSGTPEEVLQHLAQRLSKTLAPSDPAPTNEDPRKPGRPRLGVVAREVTLLPRHWEWLATQPGGASVALRKLVEQARLSNQGRDQRRRAQEATYRFISAMAGDESGFEEATRALFAGNQKHFEELVAPWPKDVRNHSLRLAAVAFAASDTTPSPRDGSIDEKQK